MSVFCRKAAPLPGGAETAGVSELHSVFKRVGGLRLHARVGGLEHGGPPVVLVQGIGVSSAYFVPLAGELALDRPVAAPDLPGFGPSDRPAGVPGIRELADALLGWLDAFGITEASFVANSMGCQVVVDLVARYLARSVGLVLVAPTVDPHARTALRQALRLLTDCVREPPELLAIVAPEYAAFGLRRFVATGRSALADPIETKLPDLDVPALVVRGEHDPVVPQRWAEEAAELLPRGRLAVIPGEAHACHFTAPGAVAELIRGLA
jgi:2-hydroxy-6-oxonona-2,4-dienedioate hydrolase